MIQKCAALFRFHCLIHSRHAVVALTFIGLACAVSVSSPASAAAAYSVSFEGPTALCALAEQHSDLARFQSQEDVSANELARLISEAPAQLGKLFATEGYFNPVIRVERVASVAGAAPQLRVVIESGPQDRKSVV